MPIKNVVCWRNEKPIFSKWFYLESFSNFVFPGEQELAFYSCDTDKDCAGKDKVICDYLNEQSGYKVCKCQDGSYLDPKTETCGKKKLDWFSSKRISFSRKSMY